MKRYFFLLLILGCAPNNVNEPYAGIEAYFCPKDYCQEIMIGLIDNSTDVKCAFYELNLPELIEKLKEKNADVIIEDSNSKGEFDTGYSFGLMHNKFCILDKKTIITGSMNPTLRGNYYNNNNLIVIESAALSKNYLDEFSELKKNVYGKGEKVKHPIIFHGNTRIENYFCPEDNCKLRVINELKKANKSIYFMTFSFTDEDIGNLLWNKNFVGLDVAGIFEKQQAGEFSRFEDLKHFSNLDKNPYKMHHKVFIIDNMTVITGSFNPSKNANERNDENILIIEDQKTAKKFIAEFNALYRFIQHSPSSASEILFTKVLYNAKGSDKGKEYIELKNIGNTTINLEYYFLSDNKTNSRLNGSLKVNSTVIIKPKFSLKNSKGMLFLKKHYQIIDYVFWNGLWDLEADEGELLIRKNSLVGESGWQGIP